MKLSASRITPIALLLVCFAFALLAVSFPSKPEPIEPEKLRLAFWSWRAETPSADDMRAAVSATGAGLLFQRAGQIDVEGDKLKRIRSPKGRVPEGIEVHLVYNATRGLLRRLGSLPPERIAAAIADSYNEDAARAKVEGASVRGVQIDLDYPTRLLPEYAAMLRSMKERLPAGTKVSVTGLPTWTESKHLRDVLDQVDLWVPQLYGAAIPEHISDPQPISSSEEVSRAIASIRDLGKPYYAGLSAYGYALLFDRNGSLVEVRGDLDRSRVEQDRSFKLEAAHAFPAEMGERRTVFRAVRAAVLDGLTIEEGEFLVFDEPTAASLRANARAVRHEAGEKLLGICVFRLPTDADRTNLRIEEVAAAVFDREEFYRSELSVDPADGIVQLKVVNSGTGSIAKGEGEIFMEIIGDRAGQIEPLAVEGFFEVRTMCSAVAAGLPVICGPRRADILRLAAGSWRPGDEASARIRMRGLRAVRLTVVKNGKVVETFERTLSNTGEK